MKTFFDLLEKKNGLQDRKDLHRKKLIEYVNNKYKIIHKKYFPKKKYNYSQIENSEEFKLLSYWATRISKKFHDHWDKKIEAIEDQLILSAETIKLTNAEEFNLYDIVSSSNYSTQGFGAEKYALASAESKLGKAAFYGICGDIIPKVGKGYTDYEVYLRLNREQMEAFRRKPMEPLSEGVRMCWKRGVNPRVYWPFLSHGFEEENNLDYFGGFVK